VSVPDGVGVAVIALAIWQAGLILVCLAKDFFRSHKRK